MDKIKSFILSKDRLFSLICLLTIIVMLIIPTGFEKQIYFNAEGVKSEVISTNEDTVYNTGLINQGDQYCVIEIKEGEHKGKRIEGVNRLTGKLEFDKIFKPGDKALVLLEKSNEGEIIFANIIDHYRLNLEFGLVLIFAIGLILFSGTTGGRTILSFIFTLTAIWKIFIPSLLKGYNPIFMALIIGMMITVVTLILIAGFTKKAFTAILGSLLASIITCIIAIIFGNIFKIDGAVMPWSESLLYAGFENLNLTLIFQAGIYLSCSGAILDLAIDISAAVEEIVDKKPEITRKEILLSGFNIGKSVVGTQTTTLLLAYMGSFIGVMMVYMAQGTPMINILTSKSIASEILHTFVGCLGLIMVSPLTAFICSYIYKKDNITICKNKL